MEKKERHYSETLEKGLRILMLFNEENNGLTLTEISRSVDINKTSVYRYINTLCHLGYLRRESRTKIVKLGPVALALAHAFMQGSDLVDLIKPLIDDIHHEHQLHIDVGLLHGDAIYLVYRRESKDTLAYRSFTTSRGFHYLATGKAALAFLEDDEMKAFVKGLELNARTDRTICSHEALLKDLAATRKRGYSINNEEFVPGLVAIGAPIFNLYTGKVFGGVSFDASTTNVTLEYFENRYSRLLIELAKKISALIPID